MKWKGIVSQLGQSSIAARFAAATASKARWTSLARTQPIAAMPHSLDRSAGAELAPQASYAHLDYVRARVEVVPPDLREQALAADDLALVLDEVVQEAKLTVGQVRDHVAQRGLPPGEVEREPACLHDRSALARLVAPELGAHAGEQLVEGERLRDVVARAEPEAAQLRIEIRARRHDHDRQPGVLDLQGAEDAEAVDLR